MFEIVYLLSTTKTMDRFLCVLCRRIYRHRGQYDMPRCPHCGAVSSIFPEWLSARRSRH
jgi:hypothetical protein